jgi:hypothetical protein
MAAHADRLATAGDITAVERAYVARHERGKPWRTLGGVFVAEVVPAGLIWAVCSFGAPIRTMVAGTLVYALLLLGIAVREVTREQRAAAIARRARQFEQERDCELRATEDARWRTRSSRWASTLRRLYEPPPAQHD